MIPDQRTRVEQVIARLRRVVSHPVEAGGPDEVGSCADELEAALATMQADAAPIRIAQKISALVAWCESNGETFRHRHLEDGVHYTPYRVVAGKLKPLADRLNAALAACGTPQQAQIEVLTRERDEARNQFDRHVEWASKQMMEHEANLSERVVQLIAHRACHSAEHDPLKGRIHGYCMVCGVPWPCAYAGTPPKPVEPSDSRTPPEAPAPASHIVSFALEAAGRSPCRSKRGVVIFRDADILAHGRNHKPTGFPCDGSEACKATCRIEAVHAEQHALISPSFPVSGADALHVKAVDGVLVQSGGPSCVQCSKLLLVAGISGVWLYHAQGWRRYEMAEFHRLSLAAQAPATLPTGETTPTFTPEASAAMYAALKVAEEIIAQHFDDGCDDCRDALACIKDARAKAEGSA